VPTSEHAPPGIALAADRTVCVIRPEADRQPLAAVRLVHRGRLEARAPPQTDVEPMGAATGPTNHAKPLPSTERGTVEVTHCNSSIIKMIGLDRSERQGGAERDP
jgi:hypothetical protein